MSQKALFFCATDTPGRAKTGTFSLDELHSVGLKGSWRLRKVTAQQGKECTIMYTLRQACETINALTSHGCHDRLKMMKGAQNGCEGTKRAVDSCLQ